MTNKEPMSTDEFNKKGHKLLSTYLINFTQLIDEYCDANEDVGVKERLTVYLMSFNHAALFILQAAKHGSSEYVKDVVETVKAMQAEKHEIKIE